MVLSISGIRIFRNPCAEDFEYAAPTLQNVAYAVPRTADLRCTYIVLQSADEYRGGAPMIPGREVSI